MVRGAGGQLASGPGVHRQSGLLPYAGIHRPTGIEP